MRVDDMDYKEHIARAVDFIEEHLCEDIDLAAYAAAAGYSVYHFVRVFKEVLHLTPADYLRKRRLSEIAKRMHTGGQSLAELAFRYGFNSKENFTRAFKSEHGIAPSEFRTAANSLKLYERAALETKPFCVVPKIVTLDAFSLTVYANDEPSPPMFWNKYNARKWSLRLSGGAVVADYGVGSWNEAARRLDYFIGIRSEQALGDVAGTQTLLVPGGLYAVFSTPPTTHADFVNAIHRTWRYIEGTWLPQSGYRRTDAPMFETYVEVSRTFSERIFIPIAPAEPTTDSATERQEEQA